MAALAQDPDQPFDDRLHAFASAGFGLATAVPFDIFHFRGMVVFFANPHADEYKLNSPNNIRMIQYAAQCIGSVAAMRNEANETARVKKRIYKKNWKCLKAKILAAVRFRGNINDPNTNDEKNRRTSIFQLGSLVISMQQDNAKKHKHDETSTSSTLKKLQASIMSCLGICGAIIHALGNEASYRIQSKSRRWITKLQGGNSPLPPNMSSDQVIFTLFGTLIAHSLLSAFHYCLRDYAGGLIIGPLGALTTLQYNLTAAPASQVSRTFRLCDVAIN